MLQVSGWVWTGFFAFVTIMLILDLGVLNRRAHAIQVREALWMSLGWVMLAAAFAGCIWWFAGHGPALEFITGYLVEESLSVDNLFVFMLIFNYFAVPRQYQHKVLFWGVIGAIVLRGIFIFAGVWLLQQFSWLIYVFGVFLVYTAIKLLGAGEAEVDPERNVAIRILRRMMPVTHLYDGPLYFSVVEGRRMATPLFVVIIALATTDIVFALDSIPTILGITQERFIVLTSNIMAVMGLRAIFFALTGILALFRYLDKGLCAILILIGVKMLLPIPVHLLHLPEHWAHVPVVLSLGLILAILAVAILASVIHARLEARQARVAESEAER
jgi:tellurite resistance protein TerC